MNRRMPFRTFSERYTASIPAGKLLEGALPTDVRERIAEAMASHNHATRIQWEPEETWISNSDVMEVTGRLLYDRAGAVALPPHPTSTDSRAQIIQVVRAGNPEHVFDSIELMHQNLNSDRREAFAQNLNFLFEKNGQPWRLFRGEVVKLNEDMVGATNVPTVFEMLAAGPFAGAAAEFAEALARFAADDAKGTIVEACKSLESTMKVLTGLEHENAANLVKALLEAGYLDDLPESVRLGFGSTVLMSLPFLRNKLGGHGQGGTVVEVPSAYGHLALQLGAAMNNFLISKYLERNAGDDPPDEEI
ncbi:MAG: hypothetical protein F8N37_17850 [Telmatospirillum sp.]|nr:hypothetical protein [Telmatospirillum sp.]